MRDQQAGRHPSPPIDPSLWKSAVCNQFDAVIDELKASLSSFPRPTAHDIWHDFLSWLSDFRRSGSFSRTNSIPQLRERFQVLSQAALTSMQEEEERASTLAQASSNLSAAISCLTNLELRMYEIGDGVCPDHLVPDYTAAQDAVDAMRVVVDDLEGPPESIAGDADMDIAVPAPLGGPTPDAPPVEPPRPWTQGNYEDFYDLTAPLFPSITGKTPLSKLLVTMDIPAISKILLPCPLELYSTEDLKSALPKGACPWLNRYEDPVEPFKCWSPEQFSSIYSKPAFYFLVARVALRTPMFTDPKLTKLRSALSERWGTEVSFERIPPCQDWMLCSIPSPPGPTDKAYEILSTALICLSDGNASFVVRHIAPASTIRDLDITIRGSTVDASAVFQQVKKKQLEFESSGVFIRWRIMGVRPSNAVSKYRATFLLDSSATFWPWSHSWQHLHASIPPSHNLLDFPPTWSTWKGYACQSCHNSDHFTMECPLAHIRVGGTPLVSHISMTLAINKHPAERLVAVDRSLNPWRRSASAPDLITAAFAATPIPDSSPPRPKSPNTTRTVDTAYRFLAAKLHSIMDRFPGLSLGLIQSLCSLHGGNIPMVIANFRSHGMDIPWDSDALDAGVVPLPLPS
jgi:hypothetical protein